MDIVKEIEMLHVFCPYEWEREYHNWTVNCRMTINKEKIKNQIMSMK